MPAVLMSRGLVDSLAGPYLVVVLLLVVAGSAKLVRPGDTAKALRRAGVGYASVLVRLTALAELLIGCSALVVRSPAPAFAAAASYAGFTAVVLLARRNDVALATCGCFGEPDTPPTAVHAAVTAAASLVAATAAVAHPRPSLLSPGQLASPVGAAWLLGVVTVTYLAYLTLSALGRLQGSVRLVHPKEQP